MIARIEGEVVFKAQRFVVLETAGVGYKIFISMETLSGIPATGEKFILWIHTHVREDDISLYGFLNYSELEFFEQLIQISGIGPKSALAVLSVAPLDVLKKAIGSGEISYLTKVSGIGKKLAEKIILELKDKLSASGVLIKDGSFVEGEYAVEALKSLGYSLRESREAVMKVGQDIKGTENIVREALRNINKN
ncbi:MAG: Holliday junction branch migration protein RuvA [Candidatus Pacebacteria bacterium]|nr:Holliday junction branch migration protein RuvA [Candidatus Paceibacterota bacterium]